MLLIQMFPECHHDGQIEKSPFYLLSCVTRLMPRRNTNLYVEIPFVASRLARLLLSQSPWNFYNAQNVSRVSESLHDNLSDDILLHAREKTVSKHHKSSKDAQTSSGKRDSINARIKLRIFPESERTRSRNITRERPSAIKKEFAADKNESNLVRRRV